MATSAKKRFVLRQTKTWLQMIERAELEPIDIQDLSSAKTALELLLSCSNFNPVSDLEWKLLITTANSTNITESIFPTRLREELSKQQQKLSNLEWLEENRHLLIKKLILLKEATLSEYGYILTTHAIKKGYTEPREQISANALDQYSKNKNTKPAPVWLCKSALDLLEQRNIRAGNEAEKRLYSALSAS